MFVHVRRIGARLTLMPGGCANLPRAVDLSSAKTKRIGSAAAKCSNQADLHLTFTDPIWPSRLPQRPSSTSVPLATAAAVPLTCHIRQRPAVSHGHSVYLLPSSRPRRVLHFALERIGLPWFQGTGGRPVGTTPFTVGADAICTDGAHGKLSGVVVELVVQAVTNARGSRLMRRCGGITWTTQPRCSGG
jgi:hypothetical protein